RIHEVAERTAPRPRQRHVVGVVESDPVHLPRSEEPRARGAHLLVGHREMARRLLEDDLADVGGIDRHPAEAGQIDLPAAGLRGGLSEEPPRFWAASRDGATGRPYTSRAGMPAARASPT